MNKFMFILALISSEVGQAQNDSIVRGKWLKDSRLTAKIDNRTSYEFKSEDISKSELILTPELNIPFSKSIRLVTIGRVYSELTNRLEPEEPLQNEVGNQSKRLFVGDRTELELREFYLDWKIGKHYLTLGKQQVVWGEADGLKILDVVNPINMREFLFDDFEYSRIPLWSAKLDLKLKKIKAQLLWIPDQTYHDIPNIDAPFFPSAFLTATIGNVNLVQKPIDKPNDFFKDADAGVRLGAFLKGWDITLNYFYNYDDFPIAPNQISNLDSNIITLTVAPGYKRYHLVGGTFNNAFRSVTLRGEVGYSLNRWFNSVDPSISAGIFQSNQLAGVLGLDYTGISNTSISAQLFSDYVFRNVGILGREQLENNASLLVSRNFRNETIIVELIGVQNLNMGDGFIRPKLKWLSTNNLTMAIGADFIYGKTNRSFGQFQNRSRVNITVQIAI